VFTQASSNQVNVVDITVIKTYIRNIILKQQELNDQ